MNNLIKYAFFYFSLANLIFCGKKKVSLPEAFITALNNYKKDSLQILTSDKFELKETYVSHSFNKTDFLDSFVTFSKAINGKFKILKSLSTTEPAILLVKDLSDYSKYLDLKPLTWQITIATRNGKVEEMISDTTAGYQDYLDDFIIKHDNFIKWLDLRYPEETETHLYHDTTNLFAKRLKEYYSSKAKR